ncbi:hypothetical protein CVT24_012844, partial [Panaeolus cyanescens]
DYNGTVHLVLDGWTSPLTWAYLGLVVIWCQNGHIYRSVLEFIRLTHKHDGRYLSQVVGDCLIRYGLHDKLFSICMDNATNCDKLAELLPEIVPSFQGKAARLRCLAHVINLIAKVFISFFFKKPKPKKRVQTARGQGPARYQRAGEVNAADSSESSDDEGEVVSDDDQGDESLDEENEAVIEAADEDLEANEGDEGQGAYNEKVARTISERAIRIIKDKGIVLDAEELKISQQIFPRVAGLARKVHDSPTLKEKFDKMVKDDPELNHGQRRTLTRRVPTRWNSDLACLESYFYFRDVVERLTSISSLKLKGYQLSPEQWKIAEDVQEVLLLFDGPTKMFSQTDTPLIVDVIPALEEIREGLIGARDDEEHDVPNVVRVACQAGILLVDKYSAFTEDCDIYLIAIVMCPDRKLKWYKDHGRVQRQIKEIEKKVIQRWNDFYEDSNGSAQLEVQAAAQSNTKRSRWAPIVAEQRYPPDHIQTYLKEPLVLSETIQEAGGYIQYWENATKTRPRLAQMAKDFCSAPAAAVDAERSFSTGRRQVNHLQTGMSSDTFKAKMAVGSWSQSPIYPGFKAFTTIIEKEIMRDRGSNVFYQPAITSTPTPSDQIGNI